MSEQARRFCIEAFPPYPQPVPPAGEATLMDFILTALYLAAVVFAILAVFHNPALNEFGKYVVSSLVCLASCVILVVIASMGAAQAEEEKKKVPSQNTGPR